MRMIKSISALSAVIAAASPAAACELEMNGGPHRFFAFASQLAAMQGDEAERVPPSRAPAKSEQSDSDGAGAEADAQQPTPEAGEPESKQDPSDAATFR